MINTGMYKFYKGKSQFRAKLEGRNFCPQKVQYVGNKTFQWTVSRKMSSYFLHKIFLRKSQI